MISSHNSTLNFSQSWYPLILPDISLFLFMLNNNPLPHYIEIKFLGNFRRLLFKFQDV